MMVMKRQLNTVLFKLRHKRCVLKTATSRSIIPRSLQSVLIEAYTEYPCRKAFNTDRFRRVLIYTLFRLIYPTFEYL